MSPKRALFLHDYTDEDNIKQTFLDLYIPWRKTPDEYFRNCSIISPTKEFKDMLPEQELPTVTDWFNQKYIDFPELRQKNWIEAYILSCELFL